MTGVEALLQMLLGLLFLVGGIALAAWWSGSLCAALERDARRTPQQRREDAESFDTGTWK